MNWYENERLVDVISPPWILPLIKGLDRGKEVVNVTFTDGRSMVILKDKGTLLEKELGVMRLCGTEPWRMER